MLGRTMHDFAFDAIHDEQVRKIMGSNWLRFYEHSWRPESVREVPVTPGPREPLDPEAVKTDPFSTVSVPARQS